MAEAVQSILRQSFTDFELILIDDGSNDGSSEDLARFAQSDPRVRLIKNAENLGLTRSLNKGIGQALGEFIARQDADDISLPHRLLRQVEAMDSEPGLAFLGAGIIEMDDEGREGAISLQPSHAAVIKRKMLFENAFFHPTVIWRSKAFSENGLFYDENLRYAQDYKLFSQALWQCGGGNLAEPLLKFRAHGGQISKQRVEGQQTVADQVAWKNFKAFGLGGEFKREDVALLRRLGIRSTGLSSEERSRQWALWRGLFDRLEADLKPAELAEWRQVKRVRLKLLRRNLAVWPLLPLQLAGVLASDPWGAIGDLVEVTRNRLRPGRG
ncbi:glycosyltransferase [Patescibacteria group bacterium]|nr:glycosyltransferase [Patescibacteria group bacterium]MBU1449102.1 glycosyltransferase [Patescibacteria group bacterium]